MWYQIKNKTETERAEVFIFDEIGLFGITAQDFVKDLKAIKANEITLRLNTPGGNVFAGIAISNSIKNHPAKFIAEIDGIAASIGSIIALAADEVNIAETGFMMIHKASGISIGNSEDMLKMSETLDKIDGTLAKVYADRTKLTVKESMALMADETWFSGQEAVDIGLADSVRPGGGEEALFDFSKFNNTPDGLAGKTEKQMEAEGKRETEKMLREVGFSHSEAKVLISGGAEVLKQRDVAASDEVAVMDTLNKFNIETLTQKFNRS